MNFQSEFCFSLIFTLTYASQYISKKVLLCMQLWKLNSKLRKFACLECFNCICRGHFVWILKTFRFKRKKALYSIKWGRGCLEIRRRCWFTLYYYHDVEKMSLCKRTTQAFSSIHKIYWTGIQKVIYLKHFSSFLWHTEYL